MRIGRVKTLEIDINETVEKRVLATLSLEREIEMSAGAKIMIQESTLLGGRHVFIDPGEPGGPPLGHHDGAVSARWPATPSTRSGRWVTWSARTAPR